MTPREHWTIRLLALLVIAACTAKCAPQETLTINVPPRPPADGLSHPLTAEQLEKLEEQKHPKPIAPKNLDGYFADYRFQ